MATSSADADTGETASVTTIQTNTTKPAADSTDNTVFADVVGSKDDTALATPLTAAVTATASQVRYQKTLMARTIGPTAADNTTAAGSASAYEALGRKDDTALAVGTASGTTETQVRRIRALYDRSNPGAVDNVVAAGSATLYETVGRKDDAAVYTPSTTKSALAQLKGVVDLQEKVAAKAAAVMVNADTLFTVAGGPIAVEALWSECVTANDATASTLQYQAVPTVGSAQTISGASASLANAAAGASVSLIGTALSTAASYNANGPNLGMSAPGGIIVPAGTVKAVIGVGSTTGTWRHYLRFRPLATGVTVT